MLAHYRMPRIVLPALVLAMLPFALAVAPTQLARRGPPLKPRFPNHVYGSLPSRALDHLTSDQIGSSATQLDSTTSSARALQPFHSHDSTIRSGQVDHSWLDEDLEQHFSPELLASWLADSSPRAQHLHIPNRPIHDGHDALLSSSTPMPVLQTPRPLDQIPHTPQPQTAQREHFHSPSYFHNAAEPRVSDGATSQVALVSDADRKEREYHRSMFNAQRLRTLVRQRGTDAGKKHPSLLEAIIAKKARSANLPAVPRSETHLRQMRKSQTQSTRRAEIDALAARIRKARAPPDPPSWAEGPEEPSGRRSASLERLPLGHAVVKLPAHSALPTASRNAPGASAHAEHRDLNDDAHTTAAHAVPESSELEFHTMHKLYQLLGNEQDAKERTKIKAEMRRQAQALGLPDAPATLRRWYTSTGKLPKAERSMTGMHGLFQHRDNLIASEQDTTEVDTKIKAIADHAGVPMPTSAQSFYNSTYKKRVRDGTA
ncbi:hypothetical protein IE81DRAFT_41150 [Ceraceosorus guamensis]|uniref:Homeobox domain-containing protein n=1 Tax=Ceraceosorus guamensis TaxID=1522189 RepID=A0A316VSQ6_9BASI|nr:hypothetical protein IE81DRAFT_41150 [Ceraceosorus guamensis]PWN39241.1 hypothetical protein IE81DRAFT_41150 [Ceraceosorus guamensis]